MKIRTVLSGAIAVGLLVAAPAQAVMRDPSNAATGSSMFVTVFDQTSNESFTTDLGLFYSSFVNNTVAPGTILPGAYTARTFKLDMAVFADNEAGNVRFNVYAGDSLGTNINKGIVMTSNGVPTPNNGNMNAINTAASAEIIVFNTNCPGTVAIPATGCAGLRGDPFGDTIGGQWAAGSTAGFDQELGMFLVTGSTSPSPAGLTTVTAFEDAFGRWNWMLAEGGTLTWSGADVEPIPLPAAAWLLISGLVGLGALGRRSGPKA